MDGELVYEIERYSPRGEQEQLLERTQVLRRGQTLWRRGADGVEVACSGNDVAAVICADPTLGEVRADEITRIQASGESLRDLPLVLSAPGGGELVDRSRWSEAMWDKHLEDAGSATERGVHRVLYVNGARWPVFPTSEGERFLPEDPKGDGTQPLLTLWALMGFTEEASMTSGFDNTEIGLVTPGVVACTTYLDDEGYEDVWLRRRDDDAATFVEWLLGGRFSTYFDLDSPRGAELLTQLFVEASLGGHNGEDVPGSRLLDEGDGKSPPRFGLNDSSMWTLKLALEPSVVNAILDLLADRGSRLAEIVEAARDPDSPAGHARRAWLEQREQERKAA